MIFLHYLTSSTSPKTYSIRSRTRLVEFAPEFSTKKNCKESNNGSYGHLKTDHRHGEWASWGVEHHFRIESSQFGTWFLLVCSKWLQSVGDRNWLLWALPCHLQDFLCFLARCGTWKHRATERKFNLSTAKLFNLETVTRAAFFSAKRCFCPRVWDWKTFVKALVPRGSLSLQHVSASGEAAVRAWAGKFRWKIARIEPRVGKSKSENIIIWCHSPF